MKPLPEPEAGEPIERLRGFVNVETDDDFLMIVGWVVAALRPDHPFPILIINGEQGSAKSTVAKVLRSLIDPSGAPTRSAPHDERDLSIAAHNNWCLSFDNLSRVPPWMSDAFCRLSTQGGYATRELHSDWSEVVFDAMRPLTMNGIGGLDARPDLGDRAFAITLQPISENRRRTEAEFWADFETARPFILGTLCDGVVSALKRQGQIKLTCKPRMADAALWIEAAEPGLGFDPGSFNRAYAENRSAAERFVVENDPIASAVRSLVEERGEFEGSASELLPLLDARVSLDTKGLRSWPKRPSTLGQWLNRLAPALRAVGVDPRFNRVGKARDRVWTIRFLGEI